MALNERHCVPCEGGVPPLSQSDAQKLLLEVPSWHLDGGRLVRDFEFKDFQAALDWIVAAGAIAETENHHPDLHLTGYRNVRVILWTHAIDGLSDNDFILAAKLDQVPR